jgi:hypothetical protein
MTAIFAGNLATHLSGHWPKAARANAVQIALADRFCVSEAENLPSYLQDPPETCNRS